MSALFAAISAYAEPQWLAGFSVPETTISLDGRYGILVPDLDHWESGKNQLVDMKTGKVIAAIDARTGVESANHISLAPSQWAPDNSLLLWKVDGKWCPWALALLKLESGTVKWQVNLLETAQQEILKRTKKAAPKDYEKAKKANAGSGSAFPEGFTINVSTTEGTPSLPLVVRADLTSNPKGIEGFPQLDAYMDATVDKDGKFVVTKYSLGTRPSE